MEIFVIHLLIAVIVFAMIIGVIKAVDSAGWLAPPIGRISVYVVGALFFIWLLLQVVPLLHIGAHL